jgi:peptidoglycan/xylan/chitin deacetylase (PgdA/CDA1 family)
VADTLVLCYHAVSREWDADLSVTPAALAAQLERLHRRGYRGVTFSEAVRGAARGRRVAVTFDDAFRSVAELARPVLNRLGWPATVFAVSSFAASGGPLRWEGVDHWLETPFAHELAGMRWDELAALAGDGWEIGSHTVTHPRLTRTDDAQLARELRDSREAVEAALGRPCPTLAYPYGDVDGRVVAAARAAGYEAAAALPARWGPDAPLEFPRAGIYHPDDMRRFALKTSPAVRRARAALRR